MKAVFGRNYRYPEAKDPEEIYALGQAELSVSAVLLDRSASLEAGYAVLGSLRRDKRTGLYTRAAFLIEAERMIRGQMPGYYVLSCLD